MGKVRLYELAQELGMPNKLLVKKLEKLGYKSKAIISSFDETEVEEIKKKLHSGQDLSEDKGSKVVIRRKAKKVELVDEKEEKAPLLQKEEYHEEVPKEAVAEEHKDLEAVLEHPPSELDSVTEIAEPKMSIAVEHEVEVKPSIEPETPLLDTSLKEDVQEVREEISAEPVLAEGEPLVSEEKPETEESKKLKIEELKVKKKAKEEEEEKLKGKVKKRKVRLVTYEEAEVRHTLHYDKDEDNNVEISVVEWAKSPKERSKHPTKRRVRVKPGDGRVAVLPTLKVVKKKLKVADTIMVGELSKRMGVKVNEVIKKLMELGTMATINYPLDFDTASIIAGEFNCELENITIDEDTLLGVDEDDSPESLVPRPAVVTVMGHVDHGKTSLLDAIRQTNVMAAEAGGITQHIGAYHVVLPNGDVIFLDTPGHEAFTAMRTRGAKVTDIVVLVVAADDGIKEQTVEAINHAKAANVPIIVAINKIDKPESNTDNVKRELSHYDLLPEQWGGNTIVVEVSAKKKEGITELLELILLQAEMMDLKANPHKHAKGAVIEAKLDKGRGPIATVLVEEGTLRVGDSFVVGTEYGKVRILINDKMDKVNSAGPSIPVEVLGISGVPQAGDSFISVSDEKKAKQITLLRQQKMRERELTWTKKITLEDLYDKIKEGKLKELNLIIKADVHGSLEALKEAFAEFKSDDVRLNVIHSFVGGITESDVMLASASNAVIIGFNVKPEQKTYTLINQEKVDVRLYNVIYEAIEDVKKAMEGMLEPKLEEKMLGRVEVRHLFNIPRFGTIAGSYVLDGKVVRHANARLLRDNTIVYTGKIVSLKRFKDDAREVSTGYECGIGLENYDDIRPGDIIEVHTFEKVAQRL
ncbi:MAG: translation initiation factor IF-2 [Thermodesulfobacteriota bacterium]|nr:translation initiation factor IF-2 [Thermodesulfobacteriota bacterium]